MSKDRPVFKIIIIILVTAFVLASCSGSSTASVTGEGVVSSTIVTAKIETSGNLSAGQLVQLTWGTSGLIDTVTVKVGQKVKAGDVLATLKLESVPANMITAQADLATAKRNLEDALNSNLSQAEAYQAVLTTRKAVEVAQNNLDALAYPRASDTTIKNTQAQIWAAEKTLTMAHKRYKEVQNHPDGDTQKTSAQLALTAAQLSLNTLVGTYNWYTTKATQSDFDEARAALEVARANFAIAQRKRDNNKSGPDPLTIEAARAKVIAAQAVVNGMQSIAPFDGEIIALQAIVGNSVNQSDASVAMVDRNTLKIDTQIDESSISSIAVGNNVEVTMDSLPGEILKGKVTLINPIGTTVNGLVKYTVTVALDPTDKPLLFGATASVVILTGEPRAMLTVPVSAVQTGTKGEYVVVINADGSTQDVAVTSGDLVESSVTITTTGKLAEGDTVQLGASSSSSGSSNNRNNGGGILPGVGGPGGGPGG